MDIGVNYMREHMIDAARVHGAITNSGGIAPNVIPAETGPLCDPCTKGNTGQEAL